MYQFREAAHVPQCFCRLHRHLATLGGAHRLSRSENEAVRHTRGADSAEDRLVHNLGKIEIGVGIFNSAETVRSWIR